MLQKNDNDTSTETREYKKREKYTPESFFRRAKEIHGIKYHYPTLYSEEKLTAKSKIEIVCTVEKHGSFLQRGEVHLQGMGCPKCGGNYRKTTEEFIAKSKIIHGEKYDYKSVKYINNLTNVELICSKHGLFLQQPKAHLKSHGCNKCSREENGKKNAEKGTTWRYSDWEKAAIKSKKFDSFKVYIIQCSDPDTNEHFFKIGKTFMTIKQRFDHKKAMPYSFNILKIIESKDGREICELEYKLKMENKEFQYKPLLTFGGHFECFSQLKKI